VPRAITDRTSNLVYTTSRASALGDFTVDYYPFRAAGRLFFEIVAWPSGVTKLSGIF
jgi:hypothetical protein